MSHSCQPGCPCRIDVDKAIAALDLSSRILANAILKDGIDIIETRYAAVRACQAILAGSMAAFRDHLIEAEPG